MQPNVTILTFSNGSTTLYHIKNNFYDTQPNGRTTHSVDYILNIKRDNGELQYPIQKISVDGQQYAIGSLIKSNSANTHQKEYEPILKFSINADGNLMAHTKSFKDNGLNVLKIENDATKNLTTVNIKGVDYSLEDTVIQDDVKMIIKNIIKKQGNIFVTLECLSYPGQQDTILADNLGPLTQNPNEPDLPRSFENNPILITEDGINAFDGDTVFCIKNNKCSRFEINEGTSVIPEGIFFSSEENALEHILKNMKLFSYQDIIDLEIFTKSSQAETLLNFAKTKLNEQSQIS